MRPLSVVTCIDVEPDAREVDIGGRTPWRGFEALAGLTAGLRPHLEELSGAPVRFGWYLRMDPQIGRAYGSPDWVFRRYGKTLQQIQDARDDIGLHVHPWRWDGSRGRWVGDHADQAWIEECVRLAFTSFEDALGRPCRSFRFGDHWLNEPTVDLLEMLGVRHDLTVEPGREPGPEAPPGEIFIGAFPDYTDAPWQPYRPARDDFRRAGSGNLRRLWMVPVAAGWVAAPLRDRMPARLRKGARPAAGRNPGSGSLARAMRWAVRQTRLHRRFTPLNLGERPDAFARVLDARLSAVDTRVLVLVARSDVGLEAPPRANLLANVDRLVRLARVRPVRFETVDAAVGQPVGDREHLLDPPPGIGQPERPDTPVRGRRAR